MHLCFRCVEKGSRCHGLYQESVNGLTNNKGEKIKTGNKGTEGRHNILRETEGKVNKTQMKQEAGKEERKVV